LLANAARVGKHLAESLKRELKSVTGFKEIRGQGLMIGLELTKPCGDLVKRCAENGLLISVTADTVVRMVPPLILTITEADEIVGILCPLIKQFLSETP